MRLPVGTAALAGAFAEQPSDTLPQMSSSALQEAMRRLSKGLSDSVAESGVLSHALTKGELREGEVHRAFRPHIPQRYELSSGIVLNAAGEQSLQQDLIISDNHTSPPFITGRGIGVHPIETVYATTEIKTNGGAAGEEHGPETLGVYQHTRRHQEIPGSYAPYEARGTTHRRAPKG